MKVDLGFDYYLGGSREMAKRNKELITITETTDWDFYATWSVERENILLKKGFTLNESAMDCRDSETVDIYEGTFEGKEIDFILRVNAEFYSKVWKSIFPEFYYTFLWKSSPKKPLISEIILCMEQLFATGRKIEGRLIDDI